MRRQRIEQVMQICVPDLETANLDRRRDHGVVVVAVAARVHLVRTGQQLEVDLEMPPVARGLLPEVETDVEHRLVDGPVIAGDVLVDGGLRPAPKVGDVRFLIEGGEQRPELRQGAASGGGLGPARLLEEEARRGLAYQRVRDVRAEIGMFGPDFADALERRRIELEDRVANGFAQRVVAGRCDIGGVAGGIDRGHHGEHGLAGIELAGFGLLREGRKRGRQNDGEESMQVQDRRRFSLASAGVGRER